MRGRGGGAPWTPLSIGPGVFVDIYNGHGSFLGLKRVK